MTWQSVGCVIGWLLLVGSGMTHGAEHTVTGAPEGANTAVSSLTGVAAIANVLSGGAVGAALTDHVLLDNQITAQHVTRSTAIQASFHNNHGIFSVNQEAGNLNNQANVRVITVVDVQAALHDLTLQGATLRTDNTLVMRGGERANRITNSFHGTVGLVGVNQSAGNLNQQANVVVLGLGLTLSPDVIALGDSTLGEVSADNTVTRDAPGPRAEILTDSFTNFHGIAQVSQSSGDLNTVNNFLGLSVSTEVRR